MPAKATGPAKLTIGKEDYVLTDVTITEHPSARLAGRNTAPLREALRLLNAFTGYTCNPEHLRGANYAPCRAQVLSALYGRKVPTAKAGVNALRTALAEALYAPETCQASTVDYIKAQAKWLIANPDKQPWEKPPTA